jgi:hypothetical protein
VKDEFLVKNSLVKKIKCVRECVVMQQPVLIQKVQGKVFAHFHSVTVNGTMVCRINCLACQDKFFVNNPLDVKMMSMLLTLLSTCLAFFGVAKFGLSLYGSYFLPWMLAYSLSGSLSHFFRDLHKV